MRVECLDFARKIVVALSHALVGESHVIKLSSRKRDLLLFIADLLLEVVG